MMIFPFHSCSKNLAMELFFGACSVHLETNILQSWLSLFHEGGKCVKRILIAPLGKNADTSSSSGRANLDGLSTTDVTSPFVGNSKPRVDLVSVFFMVNRLNNFKWLTSYKERHTELALSEN